MTGVSGSGHKFEASEINAIGVRNDHRSGNDVNIHGGVHRMVGGSLTFNDKAAGIQNFQNDAAGTQNFKDNLTGIPNVDQGTSSSSDSEDAKKKELHEKLLFYEDKYSSNPEELKEKLLEISNEYEELKDWKKAKELLNRANQIKK